MTDLISRSDISDILRGHSIDTEKDVQYVAELVHKRIGRIDAVPVVRCKDCIYRDRAMRCIALYYGFNPHDEWFCANGTRMDDEKSEEDTNGNQTD